LVAGSPSPTCWGTYGAQSNPIAGLRGHGGGLCRGLREDKSGAKEPK